MATIQDAAPPDTMAVASQGGRRPMAVVGPVVVARKMGLAARTARAWAAGERRPEKPG